MSTSIYSWNVNGIRAAIRKGEFQKFVKAHAPDILCLQETKAERGQAEIDLPDYEEIWNSADKKGYAGTAIFTKEKPISIIYDLPGANEEKLTDKFGNALKEGRVITAEFADYYLVTVYTPNAKGTELERLDYRHKAWDPAFLTHLIRLNEQKPVIVCGDLNVAHKEIDLARPKDNRRNAGFTDEEREGMDKILEAGFVDTFRHFYPDTAGAYTWWSNFNKARERNVGWRIDFFLVSEQIVNRVTSAKIHADVYGSDHCPVSITLN